jgi:hypothetical protein
LGSSANEATFFEWLKNANCKNYTPARIINSLSKASKLLVKRKYTDKSIWEIEQAIEFSLIHKRAIKDKIFCVLIGHKAMPLYKLSSELYYLFLKENASAKTEEENDEPIVETKTIKEPLKSIKSDNVCSAIDLVLSEKFSNGFAYSSQIQTGRLRKFVSEILGRKIEETDEAIIAYVKESGTELDGKSAIRISYGKDNIDVDACEIADAIFYAYCKIIESQKGGRV